MVLNHKIIACIPYGRAKYVSILIQYIIHYVDNGIIDECQFLMNTDNKDDIEYAISLSEIYPWLKLVYLSDNNKKDAVRVKDFYYQWKDPNAVYLKIDDDITYIDPFGLKEFLEFRINHPEYFIVFPTIINSAATSFYYQKLGIIPPTNPMIGTSYIDPEPKYEKFWRGGIHTLDSVAWGNPQFTEYLHNLFIENKDRFRVTNWELINYENININFIALLGKDLVNINSYCENDEDDLTFIKPKELNKICCMYGNFPVSHYAFWSQRSYLDSTDVLNKYQELSKVTLS